MLDTDIFLDILKYLEIDRWNRCINANKKLREKLMQKLELLKKYYAKGYAIFKERALVIEKKIFNLTKRLERLEKRGKTHQ